MTLDRDSLRIARDRITRVFRYLEALNEHRNPAKRQIQEQLWLLWFRDLPDHPSIRKGIVGQSSNVSAGVKTEAGPDLEKAGDDFVLKVRRPQVTHAPRPPEVISLWLEHGWEDPTGQVRIRASRNEGGEGVETRVVQFGDDPQRPKVLEAWKVLRGDWARNELPARKAMKIFEQLYELYGRIEREAERVELVLGDGILSWRRNDGGVYHPILLQRLQLEFNPTLPEFTLFETDHEVELYSALFSSMADVDGKAIARCRDELGEGDYHPLEDGGTSGFLRRLVVQLSPRGEFTDEGAPQPESEDPCIGRDPVIFLRARTLGFATAIETVLEDLQDREDLPGSLLNVVGVESPFQKTDEDKLSPEPWNDPEDILFSKHANPEQVRIAEQLERHGSVLVQGPPGTGKSHTIANLIGHLLAQGKNVLVTSHAAKALRVLRGHVVEKLRPLCVSVLESDLGSRDQLKGSVEAIVRRLSTSNEQQLEAEANFLNIRRRELLAKLRKVHQDLIQARGDEYHDIVIAGQSYAPSEAARKVAQEKDKNDWVPAPVIPGSMLPLSEGELIDLYRTNIILTPEDEVELAQILPNPNDLQTPENFDRMIKEKERLSNLDIDFRSDLWDFPPTMEGLEELEALTERLCRAAEQIASNDTWRLAAISAGRSGGANREPWDNLLSMIDKFCNAAAGAQEILLRYGPALSDKIPLEEQARIVEEILHHIHDSGKLSRLSLMMHPSWKPFIQESRVAHRPPHLAGHFHALRSLVRLKISRQELAGRWDRQVASIGGPLSAGFGSDPERACAQFIPAIQECLGWYDKTWKPLEKNLRGLGFRWEKFLGEQPPNLSPYGDLLRLRDTATTALPQILSARVNAIRWRRLEAEIEALTRTHVLSSGEKTSSQAVNRLRGAINKLDSSGYRGAFQRLVDLYNLRTNHERRRELLMRLEKIAPAWAAAIRDRRGRHAGRDVPGDPSAAWLWRHLHDELERRGKTSLEQLQQTISRLSAELRQVTAELIDRRAWVAQVRRTTLTQRQALIGWLDITERWIKKGYGKRVPRLRVEARRKMSECRTAVPVWIMPLARAVENFHPRTTRFDVVIIDEASQSDVMALIALYMARKVVIVGDHEQVSPAAVGQDLAIVQHLIDEYLQGIPNAVLYDGQMSIYDLARESFGGAICLLEHFRCVPEIIQFSNQLSYNGEIKPLRDPSLVRLKPHVISYRVGTSFSEKKVNTEEVWTVASLLAAALEQPEYNDKTFGVISLVGEEQANEIERLLLRYLPPDEYQRRQIICGNAAHFQGDERDVMFLSMVDTASGGGPLPFRDQQMFKQRFNVAASRARDQMWVIHSLDFRNDLKPGDLRRRLIEHAEDPSSLLRAMEKGEQRVQSELEKGILRRLVQAGYRVIPQWKVGYYWIDLVVEGGGKRLAIECDGDRFHPIEKLPEDMARQAILERLGWTFSRIRGSQFFRDPDSAMEPIFSRLKALEIPPENFDSGAQMSDALADELKERIIRRAQEVRLKWQETEFPDGQTDFRGSQNGPENRSPGTNEEEAANSETAEHPKDINKRPPQEVLPIFSPEKVSGEYPPEMEEDWIVGKGAAALRKLHRWAKESGNFQQSDVSFIYWLAQDIEKKKTPSPANARKVKRLWEKAVRKGFTEG